MRIVIKKELMPLRLPEVERLRQLEHYQFGGYRYGDLILEGLSSDTDLEGALRVARTDFEVEAYEVWFEIPDANIGDLVPIEVTWGDGVLTWADLGLLQQGLTHSMRYWQSANNGQFIWKDIEAIKDAGFTVYTSKGIHVRLSEPEYVDALPPPEPGEEILPLETIEWIDVNFAYGYYLDIVHAYLNMKDLYEAKGINDGARWAASTDIEKEILLRWNQVGLNRAVDLVDPAWSEGRQLKEINRKYREFSLNINLTLAGRFDLWYQYLNVVFSGTGRTKFESDWDWTLKEEYVSRFIRSFELNQVNAILDWHDTVLATYVDADFVGVTLSAAQLVNGLRQVLADKTYFI